MAGHSYVAADDRRPSRAFWLQLDLLYRPNQRATFPERGSSVRYHIGTACLIHVELILYRFH